MLLRRFTSGVARVAFFLLLVDLLLFAIFDLLPDAAVRQLGIMAIDHQLLEATRERLGVDGPAYERFATFWWHLMQGNLGRSLQGGYPISDVLVGHTTVTVALLVPVVTILLVIPIPLASFWIRPGEVAVNKAKRLLVLPVYLGLIPQFLVAVILFAIWSGLLADYLSGTSLAATTRWTLAVLSVVSMPFTLLFLAAVETFQSANRQRFTTTYRMLGMSRFQVRCRLMRNGWLALRPLAARLTLTCATGIIFTELLFGFNGLGRLLVNALRASDLNLMRVLILIMSLVVLTTSEFERRHT